MSLAVAQLRQQLAAVVAGTPSSTPGLPTGLAALDAALPGGGIPLGRITELLAEQRIGKTTITRSLVAATIKAGRCVAWIDATRTLDPRDFFTPPAGNGKTVPAGKISSGESSSIDLDALWVIRPADPARAPWCADLLLRTGAFALVVLDGAPVLPRVVAVRLAQLAREADAALLLLGDGTRASEIGGALRLVLRRRGAVTIEKGGAHQNVLLRLSETSSGYDDTSDIGKKNEHHIAGTGGVVAHRLRAYPEIPDRRGVARTRLRRSRR